jgi:hypothetical protein
VATTPTKEELVIISFGPSEFNSDVSSLDPAKVAKTRPERRQTGRMTGW